MYIIFGYIFFIVRHVFIFLAADFRRIFLQCVFVTLCVIFVVILESVGAEEGPSHTVIGDRERTG